MADINAIAKQFTDFYYSTFDTNRAALQSLYVRPHTRPYIPRDLTYPWSVWQRDVSMLSWEGSPLLGAANITEKLTVSFFCLALLPGNSLKFPQSLPFEKVQHKVTTLDAQPSSPSVASLIVSVTGLLVVRIDLSIQIHSRIEY